MSVNSGPTVAELVTQNFRRARVFERFGIDYCCGGNISLDAACTKQGVDLGVVSAELEAADRGPVRAAFDPQQASSDVLAAYIEAVYHLPLRGELKRLSDLFAHVAGHHGAERPGLREAEALFGRMRHELEVHMDAEESGLFPHFTHGHYLKLVPSTDLAEQLRLEHEVAGAQLGQLRALLDDYQPPAGACRKYMALLDGLKQFELDMHEHVHLENNVLLPRLAAETD